MPVRGLPKCQFVTVRRHSRGQRPPVSRHPPWADTPLGRHLPRQTPPGQTSLPRRHPPGRQLHPPQPTGQPGEFDSPIHTKVQSLEVVHYWRLYDARMEGIDTDISIFQSSVQTVCAHHLELISVLSGSWESINRNYHIKSHKLSIVL